LEIFSFREDSRPLALKYLNSRGIWSPAIWRSKIHWPLPSEFRCIVTDLSSFEAIGCSPALLFRVLYEDSGCKFATVGELLGELCELSCSVHESLGRVSHRRSIDERLISGGSSRNWIGEEDAASSKRRPEQSVRRRMRSVFYSLIASLSSRVLRFRVVDAKPCRWLSESLTARSLRPAVVCIESARSRQTGPVGLIPRLVFRMNFLARGLARYWSLESASYSARDYRALINCRRTTRKAFPE